MTLSQENDACHSTATRSRNRKGYTLEFGNRHRVEEDSVTACEAIEADVHTDTTMGSKLAKFRCIVFAFYGCLLVAPSKEAM